jgi:rfaE bifunctional protein kinase chain/domain
MLSRVVEQFASLRILVVGDLMLDEFIWGRVSRISPEAPVPVVNVTAESYYPGGAANVARNIREFTPATRMVGIAGTDAQGDRLLGLLRNAGIETAGVQQDASAVTTVKTRIIARNQQVVRVDRERHAPLTAEQTDRVIEYLETAIGEADAIVVADYGKGFLTQRLADFISLKARQTGTILTVDPHPQTALTWKNATAIKPNRNEAFLAAGLPPGEPVEPVSCDHALLEAGRRLLERWQPKSLLITLGEQGMLLLQSDAPMHHIPTRAQTVFDVSGAGDTAIGTFTLGLAAGATPEQAADLANRASGIVVGKLGTATITPAELLASVAQ